MPQGTSFTKTIDGDYFANTPGEVIDKWHITGSLIIKASNVTISNSQIDGTVNNEYASGVFAGPYTITDSTVGPASGCIINPGVNDQNYTATRVHIRGHDDGFRAGGPDIAIRDSYVKLCADDPNSHSDGVQDFPFTRNLVVDHTTFDLCGAWTFDRNKPACNVDANYPGINGGIFINSNPSIGGGSGDVTITNNLVIGGIDSVWLWPVRGTWIVTGNRVVEGTWKSLAYETNGQCAKVTTWSDNTTVTIDTSYNITSTVRTAACPN